MGRRECQHGQLKRQCEVCDRDQRIEALEAALSKILTYHKYACASEWHKALADAEELLLPSQIRPK